VETHDAGGKKRLHVESGDRGSAEGDPAGVRYRREGYTADSNRRPVWGEGINGGRKIQKSGSLRSWPLQGLFGYLSKKTGRRLRETTDKTTRGALKKKWNGPQPARNEHQTRGAKRKLFESGSGKKTAPNGTADNGKLQSRAPARDNCLGKSRSNVGRNHHVRGGLSPGPFASSPKNQTVARLADLNDLSLKEVEGFT